MPSEPALDADAVERILQSGGATGDALSRLVELVRIERNALEAEWEVDASAFVELVRSGLRCVDVRSPGEYERGHIPGALNVPLFDNEERALVGTCYKHSGREAAMALGMSKLALKGLDNFAAAARGDSSRVCLHCWRGGLRSGAVAWLLRRRGVSVYCLTGGYKSFRRWVLSLFGGEEAKTLRRARSEDDRLDKALDGDVEEQQTEADEAVPRYQIVVVAGRTGVGKTRVLHALRDCFGQQVLDLEAVARHRGSAFGFVADQPTNEAFENELAFEWTSFQSDRVVFIEDEEGHVGTCSLPKGLYDQMRHASLICRLVASVDQRVRVLLEDYAAEAERDPAAFAHRLCAATSRISKRLGADRSKQAVELAQSAEYSAFARLLLVAYYDKLYDAHLSKRRPDLQNGAVVVDIEVIENTTAGSPRYDAEATASALLEAVRCHDITSPRLFPCHS